MRMRPPSINSSCKEKFRGRADPMIKNINPFTPMNREEREKVFHTRVMRFGTDQKGGSSIRRRFSHVYARRL